jgi:fused signal recognition particle receptor
MALDLLSALSRTRAAISGAFSRLAGGGGETANDWEEWEAALIRVDVGVGLAGRLIAGAREAAGKARDPSPAAIPGFLEGEIVRLLALHHRPLFRPAPSPRVILAVGVNGTGKTTTVAKLARRFSRGGEKVLIAACDTYRAAAIEQIEIMARRAGAELVRQEYGGDPAAVAYDALQSALARGYGALVVDTAGRLHTRNDLKEELKKIVRVLGKARPGAPQEVFLILDGSVGQNGLKQAESFAQAVPLTGVIPTKLDGTARAGIVLAIQESLKVPVVALGTGEGIDDLIDFDPAAFARALLQIEYDARPI